MSDLRQDEDVLDTWFSSWLWPISLFDGINNPDNEEMMINEAQAYLMYTPDKRAFNARMLGLREKEIESLRGQFLSGFPDAPMAEMLR